MLVVVNFSEAERNVTLPNDDGETLRPMCGSYLDPSGPAPGGQLTLRPLEAVVLKAE
jgi:hypothetical protein